MATSEAKMTGAGSHSVRFDNRGQLEKEEVFPTFETTWRGAAVTVQMKASRYRHSSGMSEWRIFAEHTRDEHGNALTPLARGRMSEQLRPLVEAWLTTEEYAASRRQAFANAVQREFYDLRPSHHDDIPTHNVRRLLATHASELSPAVLERFTRAADAFDAYAIALLGSK